VEGPVRTDTLEPSSGDERFQERLELKAVSLHAIGRMDPRHE
jgi:hypothetical protein